jgi:IclR family KDG regulon transcriptional repressor
MSTEFKRVPAIDRCFAILQLFARTKRSLGISEIARELGQHKGTVFNAIHTLSSLEVLEKDINGKFRFGTTLYMLGNTAGRRSELIRTIHPYLDQINRNTKLSAFLGIRAGLNAIIIDKADTANDLKISSEVGMRLPLLAGAGGKALISQLPDNIIDQILLENDLKPYTPYSITDKTLYKNEIMKLREVGIAFEDEEYIKGIVAFAAPIKSYREDLQAAVWVVGVKEQVPQKRRIEISLFLKKTVEEINKRFS